MTHLLLGEHIPEGFYASLEWYDSSFPRSSNFRLDGRLLTDVNLCTRLFHFCQTKNRKNNEETEGIVADIGKSE